MGELNSFIQNTISYHNPQLCRLATAADLWIESEVITIDSLATAKDLCKQLQDELYRISDILDTARHEAYSNNNSLEYKKYRKCYRRLIRIQKRAGDLLDRIEDEELTRFGD